MADSFQVMQLGRRVSVCSRVRLKSMAQCRKGKSSTSNCKESINKRKWVFTIVGDARPDGRIGVNMVARVTNLCSLEREAV